MVAITTCLPVPSSFLVPCSLCESGPVTLSCSLQPLLSGPHPPLKASLAQLVTMTCISPSPSLGRSAMSRAESDSLPGGVIGRSGSRLLAPVPAGVQNILGHRGCLCCEATLKQIGDLLKFVGNVLRPKRAISACASVLCLSLSSRVLC